MINLITRGNFIGGFNRAAGYYRWTPGDRPGIELVPEQKHTKLAIFLRNLALVRYARGNLRLDIGNLLALGGADAAARCDLATLRPADQLRVNFTVDQFPRLLNLPPDRIILIFDSDREALYTPGTAGAEGPCPTRDALARASLTQAAAAHGFEVVNMEPIFRREFLRTGEHFDYLPVDGHWNGAAHRLAAEEVARYINRSAAAHPSMSAVATR